jgi:AraC-like DNA-binding protein
VNFEKPPEGFLASRIQKGRYVFPPRKSRSPGVVLVGAGWEECLSDFRIDRASFRYWALEMIDSGEWLVRTQTGISHRLKSGGVFLYGPDSQCAVQAVGNGPHRKYFLDVDGKGCAELLRDAGLNEGIVFSIAGQVSLSALFEQLIDCSNLTGRCTESLMVLLARCIYLRVGAERMAPARRVSPSSSAFERCRSYLETHYTTLDGIAEAARACHVSPEHFSRLFNKFAGTSAERFLKKLRLNQASRLLQQSSSSIKEIALQTGFKDPYHFSKVFKAAHGVSPLRFREQSI